MVGFAPMAKLYDDAALSLREVGPKGIPTLDEVTEFMKHPEERWR